MAELAFIVTSEDGEGGIFRARSAKEAVEKAVKEWGFEADPGYGFYAIEVAKAERFEFVLAIARSAATSKEQEKP